MSTLVRKAHPLRSRSETVLRNTVVVALILFFTAFFFAPIIMAFLGSFHQWNPLKGQYIPNGLANWRMVLTSDLFWRSMSNTLWFSLVAVAARVLIGLLLASALFSGLTRWKPLFRTLYYLPTITPMVAVAFVWKFMYQPQFGLLNQLLGTKINWLFDARYAMSAILFLTIWKDFGYAVVILLGGMYSLPADCFEAAEIDGASAWQRFRSITLPLLKPTVIFIVITSLISYFQTYIPVMVLTQGGPGTKTVLASYIIFDQAFVKYNFGYASAISFILFLFIALLTAISFKTANRDDALGGK
ncbi:MAG: sugar ABC transporter permease [Eubacteriales bacterium]|nr:sugar ABC transporter permease [Eubacteriales bacterium]